MNNNVQFTVGDLKLWLEGLPDETDLVFQGGLTFHRIKKHDPNLVQIEFKEAFEIISLIKK